MSQPSDTDPRRTQLLTRPAWRVALVARAPRIVAGVAAGVVMVAGVRAIVAGPPEPPPAPRAPAVADQALETFAEGFTRAYLSWDPQRPELRERDLAAYTASELDAGAGLEPPQREQTVDWAAVVASNATGSQRQVVTVAASAGGRRWDLAVPVARDRRGYMVVDAYPALVGPPPTATDQTPPEEDEVADQALADVAERAVRNYLARERDNLAADLDPAAVVSLPGVVAEVQSIDETTHSGRGRVAVAVTARLDGAQLALRYELAVIRRERWYVTAIASDPRGQPPEAPR